MYTQFFINNDAAPRLEEHAVEFVRQLIYCMNNRTTDSPIRIAVGGHLPAAILAKSVDSVPSSHHVTEAGMCDEVTAVFE